MNDRFFSPAHAFDHPVTLGLTIAAAVLLIASPLIVHRLASTGRIDPERRSELSLRIRSWWVLAPLMIVPILLGSGVAIIAVGVLSLYAYAEYARATGLFRERAISLVVTLGIGAVTFAALDHWYGLFVALVPITMVTLAVTAVLADRPTGYVQRVSLGLFAYLLLGSGLGHFGYVANDAAFRPLMLTILFCVEFNDIAAYVCGRLFGRRKLAKNTSPNKTIGGAIGALVATTALFFMLGRQVFEGTAMGQPTHLLALGLLITVSGQFGDLVLSSIKRDLGIKDMGALVPGHGGLLDRFDSLLLVAPAVYHFVHYVNGIGVDQPTRIFSGG